MKIAAALGFVVAVAVTLFYMSQHSTETEAEVQHREWKRTAIEHATPNRPERFEAMKWSPEDSANRLPASKK